MEAQAREAARGARIAAVLGDVRDRALVDRLFAERKPDVVLHAAAHKHVHPLEQNVHEGVLNNALGTYYVCSAALSASATCSTPRALCRSSRSSCGAPGR